MTQQTAVRRRQAPTVPLRRTVAGMMRGPLNAFERIGERAAGEVVRISLGPFKPYLITDPGHVQRVLRDGADHYVRDGMFWKPLHRLLGDGILADGPTWASSRRTLGPRFTSGHVETLIEGMIEVIGPAVARLDRFAESGEPLDVSEEMTRIVHQAVIHVFFGDRITHEESDRLSWGIDTAGTSVNARLLMPFVPHAIPMPGDRAFHRAVRTIDDVMLPIVHEARQQPGEGPDIVSALCRAYVDDSEVMDERHVRDDVVSMYSAATETTAATLTWFWAMFGQHPSVAEQVLAEVARTVGADPVARDQLPGMRYIKATLQEVLRLYPPGWILPRTVVADDEVGGVMLRKGRTILLSPYLTHRMPQLWERASAFDPDRFINERASSRHRYSYFPFSGGPHQCLGNHFFTIESQIIIATLLSRYTVEGVQPDRVVPRVAATLRPEQQVTMRLRRRDRA